MSGVTQRHPFAEHEQPFSFLNGWPKGTTGYVEDNILIAQLNDLGTLFGHDLLAALASRIESFWRANGMVNKVSDDQIVEMGEVDVSLARIINQMCGKHGYGRVPQLLHWMADVVLRPDTIPKYQKMQTDRLRAFSATYREPIGQDDC